MAAHPHVTTRAIPVSRLDRLSWPVSFAVGDGKWFVARAGGIVDVIDLQTGRTTSHRPFRTLAKGAPASETPRGSASIASH